VNPENFPEELEITAVDKDGMIMAFSTKPMMYMEYSFTLKVF
jgi:anthranilate/para-aminobenzoate synthase component II